MGALGGRMIITPLEWLTHTPHIIHGIATDGVVMTHARASLGHVAI